MKHKNQSGSSANNSNDLNNQAPTMASSSNATEGKSSIARTHYIAVKNGVVRTHYETGLRNIETMSKDGEIVAIMFEQRYEDIVIFQQINPVDMSVVREYKLRKLPNKVICAGMTNGEFAPHLVVWKTINDGTSEKNIFQLSSKDEVINDNFSFSWLSAASAAEADGYHEIAFQMKQEYAKFEAVNTMTTCPNCKSKECIKCVVGRNNEYFISCPDCGYDYSYLMRRDKITGNPILIDNTKPDYLSNIIYDKIEIKNPYGVCHMQSENSWSGTSRSFSTEKEFDDFVKNIRNIDLEEYQYIIISRVENGKKIVTDLLKVLKNKQNL